MYDCIIIGSGIIGCSIARELSSYDIKCAVLEKNSTLPGENTKSNNGVVYSGYLTEPSLYMTKYTVKGNSMFNNLCASLGVKYRKTGSLLVAEEPDLESLLKLYNRGIENGFNLTLMDREQLLKMEPRLISNLKYAIYSPDCAVVSPSELALSMINDARVKGVEFKLDREVLDINYEDGIYTIITSNGIFNTRVLINATGRYSMYINSLAGAEVYEKEFMHGQYYKIECSNSDMPSRVIMTMPKSNSNGVVITPTTEGHLLIGYETGITEKEDKSKYELDEVLKYVSKYVDTSNIKSDKYILSSVHSVGGKDFIVKKSKILPQYIMCLETGALGLSASPAIALKVVEYVSDFIKLKLKQ